MAVWAFLVSPFGEAGKAITVDQVPGGGGDDAAGDGAQGGGPAAVLQQGAFSYEGYRGRARRFVVPSTATLRAPSSSRYLSAPGMSCSVSSWSLASLRTAG